MMKTAFLMRRLAAAVCLLVVALFATVIASAQETTGAIQGTVTDPSSAVIADATVTATGDKLIRPQTAKTDSHGFYRLNALPPGKYSLTVLGGGMSAKAIDINLLPGGLPNINFQLVVGAETVIDVSTAVAQVDVTQSKVETTVTNEVLQEIPKGRSFQSVIPFAPGARQEPLQTATQTASQVSAALNGNRTNGFQIDGASDTENIYLAEGVNVTDVVGGGVGFNVPMEFVQDVQVKSSSFEAEYGGAMGGVVNVVQQKGGSQWHGQIMMHYRSSALNANDQCIFSSTCGLRKDPGTTTNSTTRTDQASQYYLGKQDHYRVINPGFDIGGPLMTDKLWMNIGYMPEFYRQRRDVTFTGTNPGPRSFYQSQDTHFGYMRLDYAPISKLRVFASWNDLYTRLTGNALPNPDSKTGQVNSSSTTDPTTFRTDAGQVIPTSIYIFGGDYTPTSNLLVSVRWGYTYSNAQDRGKPSGVRALLDGGSGDGKGNGAVGLDGSTVPAAYQQISGYSNLGANTQQKYNILQRKTLNADLSYLKTGWAGTHNFKVGFMRNTTFNNLNSGYKTALIDFYYGTDYTPATSATACDSVISANVAAYGASAADHCRGKYGYFFVNDYSTGGIARGDNEGIYVQDSWSVAHTGLTINAGVRFDREYLPPYSAGASDISFGFTDKVGPRIGAAYDVLHNGKLKAYGSWGKFYDIIKYSLPRGSFGGEYWHECVYALDDPNFAAVQPGNNSDGHACPASGGAINLGSSYRFIENLDLRKNVISTQDPGVDPNVKPMSMHELVLGSDWAVSPTLSIKARYARKRLDNTIEDIGVTDNLGFYIGNPGPGYGDLLHRTLYSNDFTSPLCPNCPAQPKAERDYDGFELRVMKTAGSHYFFSAYYAYSRLYGNYPGLTSTFNTDGGGGRHSPNNNRSFDQPQMQFTAHGKPFGGPLPTDRPNTLGGYGSFRQRWFLGETQLGLSQAIYQGTPVSTAWPTGTSTSSVQFVEDQSSWVPISRGGDGSIIAGAVQHNRRTPGYFQTDANLTHYISVSKQHEPWKLGAEINVSNLLGQHAITGYTEVPLTAAVYPNTTANPTGFDFNAMMTGWDYVGVSNTKKNLVASNYALPNIFQTGRQMKILIRFIF
ncbi:MAG: carboxypeptidase regulatory-like domain-containing protein [Edaphobacter sp.]|uniref:TonB-dependent receptor n=1 Tax=Edaphobacter sp. TaxID=1934404 RepID=UPI002383B1DB|nr:carboxypeptidase regulatory-like domain-containing protein [Edaphobacter sp.]MDE1176900.1 carboxypeptidase regulatory-like domain-containing protein [Edaphobacter sp.]